MNDVTTNEASTYRKRVQSEWYHSV